MRLIKLVAIIILVAIAAGQFTACGNPASTHPVAASTETPLFPDLPCPADLHLRSVSKSTHVLQGSAYRADIITPQRVALSGVDDGRYTPEWINNKDSSFDKLAYAMYAFGYDDEGIAGKLTLTWIKAPAAQVCWIGLPDYEYDRWRWHEYTGDPLIILDLVSNLGTTPEMTHMYPVVVLVTGTGFANLDKLELVEYMPAMLSLYNTPPLGSGEAEDPFQADNKLTLFLSVMDIETFAEMATDPRTSFSVTPAAAGEFQALATSMAFHLAEGFTGAFTIGAQYDGTPTDPQQLFFIAVDNGPAPNQDPVADLAAEPVFGASPLSVDFDARDSYDPDGLVKIFRWDFDGDGVFDDTSNARTITHVYDTDGIYDAKLEIEDDDGALASATARITVDSSPQQWHVKIIQQAIPDGPSNVGQFCSIADVDGTPAIAYSDAVELEQLSRVNFVRAEDALGGTWPDPQELWTVDSSVSTTGYSVQLQTVAGQPGVAFMQQETGALPYYVRAEDAQGAAWPGAPVLADGTAGVSYGQRIQLVDADGVPGLAYFDSTSGQLIWIRGTDADGTAFTGRLVLDTKQGHDGMSNVGEFCSLAIVAGYPAVSYLARHIQAEEGNEVRYLRALDASGSAWGVPVAIDQAPSIDGSIGHGTALLQLASGLPGVFYQDYTSTQCVYSFKSGADAAGSSWSGKTIAASTLDSNWLQAPSPILWNNLPLLGVILQEDWMDPDCTVLCAQALAGDGSTWQSQQEIAPCGEGYTLDLAEVGGKPVMCFYHSDQQALYFGIYY